MPWCAVACVSCSGCGRMTTRGSSIEGEEGSRPIGEIAEPVKAKMLRVYGIRYRDFGPTLAAEKLAKRQGRSVNDETLRGCTPRA